MIFIYKELIKRYIYLLKPEDIKNYAKKQNVTLTNTEVTIIYDFIKSHYNELLNNNTKCFSLLKKELSSNLYEKIIVLYNYYKNYL